MSRLASLVRAAAVAAVGVGLAPTARAQTLPTTDTTLPAVTAPTADPVPDNPVQPAGDFRLFGGSAAPCPSGPCPSGPCQPTPYSPYSPYSPYTPSIPGYPPVTGTQPPGTPTTPSPVPTPTMDPGTAPSFASQTGGAGLGESVAVGMGAYIDNAAPVTMVRMRFDSAYDSNRPDRAEFFYPKCGCFMTPDARGPALMEKQINSYQELATYLEYAPTNRWSVFTNIPVRWLNPEVNANAAGLSDVTFGTKYAFIYNPRRVVTFQLAARTPTSNYSAGLGTSNYWITPSLLWLEQLSARWQVFGQFSDNIPSRRSDFAGNVLQYGIGSSYVVSQARWGYVAPVGEFVGWTVLSGKELTAEGATLSARGDTIVNAKMGVRVGFGQTTLGQPYYTRSSLYVGYARALTGEVWYKDMFRLEYRMVF